MATTYKIRYKNHATPQEQIESDGRYYLDSDVGVKMTGNAETSASTGNGTYASGVSVTTLATEIASNQDFIYVKNTGTDSVDILLTLDNSVYTILLKDGEAFASEISTSADVRIKTASGVTSAEYYRAT